MKPVRVGLLGLGTVGGGTFNVLRRNAGEIARRAGRGIVITRVAARDVRPGATAGHRRAIDHQGCLCSGR